MSARQPPNADSRWRNFAWSPKVEQTVLMKSGLAGWWERLTFDVGIGLRSIQWGTT
jgi:hypothetical protein